MESITIKFEREGDSVVVTLDHHIESIPPYVVVQALRDLADTEEESYEHWKETYASRN